MAIRPSATGRRRTQRPAPRRGTPAVVAVLAAALLAFPVASTADTLPALSLVDAPTIAEPAIGEETDLVFHATLDQASTSAVNFQTRLYGWRDSYWTFAHWPGGAQTYYLIDVIIPAGETSVEIPIPQTGDTYDEHPYYKYELRIETPPTNATVADGVASAIVTDTTRNGSWQCFAWVSQAEDGIDEQQSCDGGEVKNLDGASPDGTTRQFTGVTRRHEADPLYPIRVAPAVGDHASASTEVGWLHYQWQRLTIEATGISTSATLRCDALGVLPALTGHSHIDHLKVTWMRGVAGQLVPVTKEFGPISGPLSFKVGDVEIVLNSVVQHRYAYPDNPLLGSDVRGEPYGDVRATAIGVIANQQPVALVNAGVHYIRGNPCTS